MLCMQTKHHAHYTSHPQTHFLLSMYDGKEISICMFLSLLTNCKLQIFSLLLNKIYLLWLVVKILFFLLYFIATFFSTDSKTYFGE